LSLGSDGEYMSYKKYTEEELWEYLSSHADIQSFYVTCLGDSGDGLINFFDSRGKNWCLMEDDDQLVADAMEFLRSHGAPFFRDMNALQDFEQKWGK
jgi:hypothetical protein